ncbi:hypothetical protein F2Q69_00008862 [Brassica cretica]|uniref:Disease resistance protein Roq1-like winged-helix domain-containing protein n=1 Tax=Brassica cretica TaxID=69181 RepID=A0A8S9PDF7_BRACR|nr:hypothetical protein F2Q69_00008862 [Brassica cretica]
MFCMCAFDQKDPNDGFGMRACEVISLVGKLPLGIRVMGSHFRGISEHDWREALPSLRTHLDRDTDILNILKFSYDALHDEDKRLFLHIACFFNLEPVDIVEGCLAKCFLDVTQGVRVLVEKSFISIEYNRIEMAELLVHFGRNIVREQSDSQPGKRQFLNKPIDIDEVLSDDKSDSGSVIGIDLNEDIACTSERAFERLSNLQFLRIFSKGVNPQSMNYISQKLRLLVWQGSEMTCFPSNFNPKFLVKLQMQDTKFEKLWEGIKPLNNLKWMDLRNSSNLKELADLSTATNLQELDLSHCYSLLPSSVRNLGRLRSLKLERCSKLEVNLANINLESLEYLVLSDCSSLKSYSENSTDIQELDPWIGRISSLQKLVLNGMENLVSLPQLPDSVVELDAEYCESLERLDCCFCNPGIRLNFKYCCKLNQEAIDLIIRTPTIRFAVFPTREVPRGFTCRSFGSSLTVKLNEMPLGESIKFKDCVIYADGHELRSVSGGGLICPYVSSGRHSIISSEKTDQFLPWHLHNTFVVEVKTEELTSTELAFYFEISYSGYGRRNLQTMGDYRMRDNTTPGGPFIELQRCR